MARRCGKRSDDFSLKVGCLVDKGFGTPSLSNFFFKCKKLSLKFVRMDILDIAADVFSFACVNL